MNSTPNYVPPGAEGAEPTSPELPAEKPAAAGAYVPPGASEPQTMPVAPAASGYTPPGAAPANHTPSAAGGYTPPGASAVTASQPGAASYTPPGASPSALPPASAGYTPPGGASGQHASGGYAPPAAGPGVPAAPQPRRAIGPEPKAAPASQAPVAPAVPAKAGPNMVLMVVVGLVVVMLIGLFAAWKLGAFEPKMSHLPTTVGTYSLDTTGRTSSATIYDSGTYRAGSGDLYQASIVKKATDPAVAFASAAATTRFQLGSVYCIGVSATGKGGTCSTLLETGSAVKVDGSTRHTAQDLAAFTQQLASAIK